MVRVIIQNLFFAQAGDRMREKLSKNKVFVTSKLNDILKNKGMSYQDLSNISGVRRNTISEIANLKKTKVSPAHIAAIMVALNISDMRDIVNIEIEKS